MRKLRIEQVMPLIRLAVAEDFGSGDITSELVVKKDADRKGRHHHARRDLRFRNGRGKGDTPLLR